jgi:hypothetical protein
MTALQPVDETNIFGRIVTGADVEAWVVETLRKWSSTYLAEVERQHGLAGGTLQRVRSWVRAPTFDKWPEDQLPAVLVISTGTIGEPLKDGRGRYRARWAVAVGTVCSARTRDLSHDQAELYAAAHRALLLQRPSLEGRANGVDWATEDYTDLPFDDTRSLGAGRDVFAVEVDDVVSTKAGPVTPADPAPVETDPYPPWPLVETHDEVIEAEPIGGS